MAAHRALGGWGQHRRGLGGPPLATSPPSTGHDSARTQQQSMEWEVEYGVPTPPSSRME